MNNRLVTTLSGFISGLFLCLSAIPAAYAMPDIQHWVTANGVRVYFVPAPELPMVDQCA